MLKNSGNIESTTQPREGKVVVGGDNRAERNGSKFDRSRVDDDEVDDKSDNEVGKKSQNSSRSKNLSQSKMMKSSFLTSGARVAFIKLR